jgi:hypothetical protein
MPFDLTSASGNVFALPPQLLGLFRKLDRCGIDLLRSLVNGSLSGIEARLAAGEHSLHISDLTLPLDQLLTEPCDRKPVLGFRAIERFFLPAQAIGFVLNLRSESSEIIATETSKIVQLGEMAAKGIASGGKAFEGSPRLPFQLGSLLAKSFNLRGGLDAESAQFLTRFLIGFQGGSAIGFPLRPRFHHALAFLSNCRPNILEPGHLSYQSLFLFVVICNQFGYFRGSLLNLPAAFRQFIRGS